MSVFGSIMSKIFGHRSAAAAPPDDAAAALQAAAAAGGHQPSPAAPDQGGAAEAAATPQQPVDVAAVLTDLASKNPQKLDWQHSIVDLMKLLSLDSGLGARKELGYSGDTGDSAAMNVWLHKQVMQKLAANGGKVPDDLRA